MEAAFCVEALEEALARHGNPQILNTDQGSQFTCHSFTDILVEHQIAISMDGRGSWRDNVFLERFWRSVKYEEVYLRAYDSVDEARASLSRYITTIGLIRALTDARPIKPSSTRCLSARRPNPGRGSTYRRGNSVQTTAATSLLPDSKMTPNPANASCLWKS
jgi:putative transposase